MIKAHVMLAEKFWSSSGAHFSNMLSCFHCAESTQCILNGMLFYGSGYGYRLHSCFESLTGNRDSLWNLGPI